MDQDSDQYSDQIERIQQRYGERVAVILNRIAAILHAAGYETVGPHEMFDDEYRWALTTKNDKAVIGEGSVDFMFEIAEQKQYEGDDAEPGVNFGLNVTAYGGRILGGFQPYNFTPEVWVNAFDDAAVEERFQLMEQADGDVLDLIERDS